MDEGRRTGKTTRLIDRCIQDFFNDGWALVRDHHGTKGDDDNMLNRFMERLHLEHSHFFIGKMRNRIKMMAIVYNPVFGPKVSDRFAGFFVYDSTRVSNEDIARINADFGNDYVIKRL